MATANSTINYPAAWDAELIALRDEIYAEFASPQFTLRDAADCALGQMAGLQVYAAAWDADAALSPDPLPPATPAQRKAAYQMSQGLRIKPHAEGWLVPSGTRANVVHFVSPQGTCSCEAGQHGRDCWHISAVAQQLQGRAA